MIILVLVAFFGFPQEFKAEQAMKTFEPILSPSWWSKLNNKSDCRSLWKMGVFNNPWLWLAVFSSLLIQVGAVQWVPCEFFNTVPLTVVDWLTGIGLGSSAPLAGEGLRFCYRL